MIGNTIIACSARAHSHTHTHMYTPTPTYTHPCIHKHTGTHILGFSPVNHCVAYHIEGNMVFQGKVPCVNTYIMQSLQRDHLHLWSWINVLDACIIYHKHKLVYTNVLQHSTYIRWAIWVTTFHLHSILCQNFSKQTRWQIHLNEMLFSKPYTLSM